MYLYLICLSSFQQVSEGNYLAAPGLATGSRLEPQCQWAAGEAAMLVWGLLGVLACLSASTVEKSCPVDHECVGLQHCPAFLLLRQKWNGLPKGSIEHSNLLDELKGKICSSETRHVCCLIDSVHQELVNGDIVNSVEDFPFMARIRVRLGIAGYVECGASLISRQWLVTATHCLTSFEASCYRPGQCYVTFRDLHRRVTEETEFRIDILYAFGGPRSSDLGLIQLVNPVDDHPDYGKGIPLTPVTLARELPQPGDKVLTLGWGRTGFDEEAQAAEAQSSRLRSLNLTVTRTTNMFIFTATRTDGVLMDPCDGL